MERRCSAEFHVESCACLNCGRKGCDGCYRTNVDHFTPKSKAKKWKWTKQQVNKPENRQFLSLECHSAKDRSTPSRKNKDTFSSLDELRDWRDRNDLVFKP
jgi:hypothetical protein